MAAARAATPVHTALHCRWESGSRLRAQHAPQRPYAYKLAQAHRRVQELWRKAGGGGTRACRGLLAALPFQCSGPPGGARRACPSSAPAASEAPLPPTSWGPGGCAAACAGRERRALGAQVEGVWTDEAMAQVLNHLDGGPAADAEPAALDAAPQHAYAAR